MKHIEVGDHLIITIEGPTKLSIGRDYYQYAHNIPKGVKITINGKVFGIFKDEYLIELQGEFIGSNYIAVPKSRVI